jgi:hypothetical protein
LAAALDAVRPGVALGDAVPVVLKVLKDFPEKFKDIQNLKKKYVFYDEVNKVNIILNVPEAAPDRRLHPQALGDDCIQEWQVGQLAPFSLSWIVRAFQSAVEGSRRESLNKYKRHQTTPADVEKNIHEDTHDATSWLRHGEHMQNCFQSLYISQ